MKILLAVLLLSTSSLVMAAPQGAPNPFDRAPSNYGNNYNGWQNSSNYGNSTNNGQYQQPQYQQRQYQQRPFQ